MFSMTGKVLEVKGIQTFASGFTKRDLIIEEVKEKPSKYPNEVQFTFKKDNCELLDGVKKGDTVKIGFFISGRKWDGPKGTQHFTDLDAVKIDVEGASGSTKVPPPAEPPADVGGGDADDTDIPF